MKGQFAILRQRTFRHLFLAQAVSWLGTAIAPVALAFAILGRPGGTATDLGLVEACAAGALVASLLAGGVLADRFARYRVMVVSDLVAFAAQGAIAALFISRTAPLGLVAALAAIGGAAGGVSYPCLRGLVPQVVDGPQVQSANALIQLAQNSTRLLGASVSGILVVGVGAGWGLAFDSLTFLLSAALVLTSGAPRTSPVPSAKADADADPDAAEAAPKPATILSDLRDGWREVRSRQWLWVCIAEFTIVNLCWSPSVQVLGPVVARQHYGGALAWSVLVTAQAIGLVGGSLLAMRLRPAFPLLFATLITFAFLPPFFLLAFHAPVWLTAISMLGIGVAIDVYEVLWVTTMQENIPPDKISRVASWDALGAFVLGPVGLVIVGPVASVLGTEGTLIGAGGLVLLSTLGALGTPSVRRLPARPKPAGGGEAAAETPGPVPSSA